MLLSKRTYREVVKGLEHFRKQHEDDRKEHPNSIPPAWGLLLRQMIDSKVRSNHEQWHKGLADQVLEYLVEKNLLIKYAGDYTFPTDERLPTEPFGTKQAV
mgnify:CR=1 FL=1